MNPGPFACKANVIPLHHTPKFTSVYHANVTLNGVFRISRGNPSKVFYLFSEGMFDQRVLISIDNFDSGRNYGFLINCRLEIKMLDIDKYFGMTGKYIYHQIK